jgi:hypothetical protein
MKSLSSAAPVLFFFTCSCTKHSLAENTLALSMFKGGSRSRWQANAAAQCGAQILQYYWLYCCVCIGIYQYIYRDICLDIHQYIYTMICTWVCINAYTMICTLIYIHIYIYIMVCTMVCIRYISWYVTSYIAMVYPE